MKASHTKLHSKAHRGGDEDTLKGHRDNEGESKKATWYQVS